MGDEPGELIRLADPPGTSGHVVSLRVLALPAPGSDCLDCELVVETETVKGSFPVHDGPSSQVTVSLPLFPAAGRIDDQRARLEKVRRAISG
ncbi:DUF5959 family protein [Streptomyces sp. NPDC056485]|uniref:DUF5959 family protein n=1 Tax=Streptomyces sp. NPDC056485 TaxID=3345834 RepID=UPI0036AE7C70